MAHAAFEINETNLFDTIRLYALLKLSGKDDKVAESAHTDPAENLFFARCHEAQIELMDAISIGELVKILGAEHIEDQLLYTRGIRKPIIFEDLQEFCRKLYEHLKDSRKISEPQKEKLYIAFREIFPKLETLLSAWSKGKTIKITPAPVDVKVGKAFPTKAVPPVVVPAPRFGAAAGGAGASGTAAANHNPGNATKYAAPSLRAIPGSRKPHLAAAGGGLAALSRLPPSSSAKVAPAPPTLSSGSSKQMTSSGGTPPGGAPAADFGKALPPIDTSGMGTSRTLAGAGSPTNADQKICCCTAFWRWATGGDTGGEPLLAGAGTPTAMPKTPYGT